MILREEGARDSKHAPATFTRRRVIPRHARALKKPARDHHNCKPDSKSGCSDVMHRDAINSGRDALPDYGYGLPVLGSQEAGGPFRCRATAALA